MSQTQTATSTEIGWNPSALSGLQWLAVLLAAVTGAIHLYLYWTEEFLPFLFAGVVFFAAILGLLFHVYPMVLYALGIPFTAGQIVLWYGTQEKDQTADHWAKLKNRLGMTHGAYLEAAWRYRYRAEPDGRKCWSEASEALLEWHRERGNVAVVAALEAAREAAL